MNETFAPDFPKKRAIWLIISVAKKSGHGIDDIVTSADGQITVSVLVGPSKSRV